MIDIHSHIICGIDDGARNEETAIEMLKQAEKSGTTKIILTPHYYKGKFIATNDEVKERFEELKILAKENDISLKMYVGQEVFYTDNILHDLREREIGTLNDSRYLLIEFDMEYIEEGIFDTIYELKIKGITPIIAHPERYTYFQKNPSMINDFIKEGCLFQINAGSIAGLLGKETKKLAQIFMQNKIYSFVGSDAHSIRRRNTNIGEHRKEFDKIDKNFIPRTIINGDKLINNQEVKFEGKPIEKKRRGLFALFSR